MPFNRAEFLQESVRLHQERIPYCTVTVADARGSIPQEIGAKALITSSGLFLGTVGGGKIEQRACDKARELLAAPAAAKAVLERVNLHKDLGMTCAGEMTLLYEVCRPEFDWNIVIFGAGHVGQKLCRLLVELDCRVTCFDTRREWLERLPDHPRLERRLVEKFEDGVSSATPGAFVVVITMGHATDLPVLIALSRANVDMAFIGALGSDSKAAIMRRELAQAGVPKDFIERIHCPIGEKFGGNTPPDIAVSVLAQLVRLRS